MKKLLYFFLNSSIGSKLMFYFLLLILLPTITITTLSNIIYKNSFNEEQNANTRQMIRQISDNVDYYINDTENIIKYLSVEPSVLKFLKNNGPCTDEMQDDVSNAILRFTSLHPEIAGIMIVNQNDIYVSDIMNRVSRDKLTDEKWYIKAAENPDKVELFSKPVGRNINNIFQYSADDVVSMSKAVIDRTDNKCIGVILIDMKLDIIKSVIENVKPGKTGFVYIVDSTGEIVYSPVNPVVARIRQEWIENDGNQLSVKKINGKYYELVHTSSSYTAWKTVGVFPLDESLKIINYIKYYSLIIASFSLILAGILAIFFTKSIVKPIAKLRALMKKTEEGNLNVYFHSKYNDEIGQLGNTFNNMIKEIKNLISMVQIQEKNKRKAEISILQAQIKPHFIYNTLDTIQWMAQDHNADDIVEIVGSLTNLLRIGVSNGEEVIKIRQEITHVESYLKIQKIRYEDKLNYKINVDKNILDYEILKLTLQPLVENAIYHGIKEKKGEGRIVITGKEENGELHFRVKDNGIGIKQDELAKINQMLRQKNSVKNKIGFGIFNVNERIRLNYGEKYGLFYSSIYGEGTVADVFHPCIKLDSKEGDIK